MYDPMLPLPGLSPVSGKNVVVNFDGGLLSLLCTINTFQGIAR